MAAGVAAIDSISDDGVDVDDYLMQRTLSPPPGGNEKPDVVVACRPIMMTRSATRLHNYTTTDEAKKMWL